MANHIVHSNGTKNDERRAKGVTLPLSNHPSHLPIGTKELTDDREMLPDELRVK